MKKVFTFLAAMIFAVTANAQGEDYDNLLIYKADQNWEKLIREAEKLTSKNKTKKDALPYYYLTYGLYKISFIGDRPDEYKNAYKDALTNAGKMGRKDGAEQVFEEYEEFYNELKMSLLEIIRNEIEGDDYRRAFGWVMKIYKFGRDHIGGKFLEGACRHHNGDKATARAKWKEGQELIKELESTSIWSEADKAIIKLGLYESAKAMTASRQKDTAVEIMNLGAQWFEGDKDWQAWYDEIVN